MKNPIALAVGIVMIVMASWLAGASTSREDGPQVAQQIAAVLPATLQATLESALTRLPARTPLPITRLVPDTDEVLTFLFSSLPEDSAIDISHAVVELRRLEGAKEEATLVVAGNQATATVGSKLFPIAFAGILRRQNGEYAVKYFQIEWGRIEPQVEFARLNNGSISFRFFNLGRDAGNDVRFERTDIVHPCADLGGQTPVAELVTRQVRSKGCF